MKLKEESENVSLKLNIQKTKIMVSGLIISCQIVGETMETVTDFIFLGSRITLMVAAAAAAAKSLQSCLTLCDPIDGSSSGYPIPGFSRQEHWSGLSFPSPMHESEKSK